MSEAARASGARPIDQMKLSLDRTFLSHERTLLSWVRTAISMITFGFGLYKFFDYLNEQRQRNDQPLLGARTYGLLIMGIGVFMLTAAAWQHRQQMKALRVYYPDAPVSLSAVLAVVWAGLGIFGFCAAVFHR